MKRVSLKIAAALVGTLGLVGTSTTLVASAQDNTKPVVNVLSYGAVGNGTTDDTNAFEQAFQALTNGGELLVPQGQYVVQDNVLSVPSGISIVGQQATIIPQASIVDGWQLMELKGSNISISGLTFNGEGKFVRGLTIGGGSSNVSITNTTVENFGLPKGISSSDDLYGEIPAAIRIEGDSNNILITNDIISNVSAVYGSSHTARGIWICPTTNADGSDQGMTTNVTVSKSTIENILPGDNADGIVTQGFNSNRNQNLSIVNNHFIHNAKRAVKIQTNGVQVLGNVVNNDFVGSANDMYAGISEYASNGVIENNILTGVGGYYCGIELGSGDPISNIQVVNNQVSNGDVNVSDPLTSIRTFGPVTKLVIENNKLNHAEYGVLLAHPDASVKLQNNSMTAVVQPHQVVQDW